MLRASDTALRTRNSSVPGNSSALAMRHPKRVRKNTSASLLTCQGEDQRSPFDNSIDRRIVLATRETWNITIPVQHATSSICAMAATKSTLKAPSCPAGGAALACAVAAERQHDRATKSATTPSTATAAINGVQGISQHRFHVVSHQRLL